MIPHLILMSVQHFCICFLCQEREGDRGREDGRGQRERERERERERGRVGGGERQKETETDTETERGREVDWPDRNECTRFKTPHLIWVGMITIARKNNKSVNRPTPL